MVTTLLSLLVLLFFSNVSFSAVGTSEMTTANTTSQTNVRQASGLGDCCELKHVADGPSSADEALIKKVKTEIWGSDGKRKSSGAVYDL